MAYGGINYGGPKSGQPIGVPRDVAARLAQGRAAYVGPPKGDQNGFNRSMRHEARAKAGMQGHAAGASGGHGGGNPNHDEQGRFT